MRGTASRVVCLTALLLPGVALGEQAPSAEPRGEQSPALMRGLARQSAEKPPQAPAAERWRYQFHHGHWWYWRKGGQWDYWTGTAWKEYSPDSYRRWYLEWRLAQNEAEMARLRAMMRSIEAQRSGRYSRVYDPDSFLPFANERGNDP